MKSYMVYFYVKGFGKRSSIRVDARTPQAAINKALQLARQEGEQPIAGGEEAVEIKVG